LTVIGRSPEATGTVIPVLLAILCSFQGPRRGALRPPRAQSPGPSPAGGRSLKTQQHASGRVPRGWFPVIRGLARRRCPPGPVDIARSRSGPTPARDAPTARAGRSNPGAP
jgi:hypothetical protein